MIAERFPALSSLTVLEKWTLAAELYDEVERRADEVPVDPDAEAAIAARCADYHAGKMTGSPWSEVKARILASAKQK